MPLLTSTRRLHIAKTISWRLIGFAATFIISWILTGKLWAGVAIGSVDGLVKMFLYYGHERAWYRWQAAALPHTVPAQTVDTARD